MIVNHTVARAGRYEDWLCLGAVEIEDTDTPNNGKFFQNFGK